MMAYRVAVLRSAGWEMVGELCATRAEAVAAAEKIVTPGTLTTREDGHSLRIESWGFGTGWRESTAFY